MAKHVRFHETGGPEVLKIEEVPTQNLSPEKCVSAYMLSV
jgi:NADPH:quinone reductase-like Zn-dependent oxidoreductase